MTKFTDKQLKAGRTVPALKIKDSERQILNELFLGIITHIEAAERIAQLKHK